MRWIFRLPILLVCLAVVLFCLLYPMYVIRPFRAQGVAELDVALRVVQIRPVLIGLCVVAGLWALIADWQSGGGRWRKVAVSALFMLILTGAGLSRVNVFEKKFHRIDAPVFEPAAQSRMDADDKVLAITVGGAARAYPVRALAYHHIVNDTAGGVPIVGTY